MFEVQICNDHAEDPADDIYTAIFQSQDLKKAQLFYQQHRSNWPICTIRLIEVLRRS
jgi:predicted P-loop ATPase/GTPase